MALPACATANPARAASPRAVSPARWPALSPALALGWVLSWLLAWLLAWPQLAIGQPSAGQPAPPAQGPVPVIELGMHTGAITGIGADAGGRWAVTTSEDKTARVWDVASGAAIGVLRPPQGPGYEGRLYCVAVSADGSVAAVSGWTSTEALSNNAIYLFELRSGRLVKRLDGVPSAINGLAFSPDGQLLAAAAGAGVSLRLFELPSGRELSRETAYLGGLLNLQFSPDGRRIVASGLDGLLHLYGRDSGSWQPLAALPMPGGRRVLAPRFSPDGRYIVTGYLDSHVVSVLQASNLSEIGRPATDTSHRSAFLAWSLDGQWLHGGLVGPVGSVSQLRTWSTRDSANFKDLPIGTSTITGLQSLPGGRVLFSTMDPSWGLVQPDGRVSDHRSLGADFRLQDGAFTVSDDARRVRFSLKMGVRPPQVFDLGAGGLVADDASLPQPRQAAPGLTLSNWRGTDQVLLNGQRLPLQPNEMARSLAISADGSRLALGTDWGLSLFSRQGQRLWFQPSSSSTWAVALSGDGRHVVSGHGDGTVRWRRTDNGSEVLALFLHTDGQRWVAWTPEGFFDASPGGEQLIGHHLNRGPAQAGEFISAAQLRERYFQPALVAQRLLPGGSERLAVATRSQGDVRRVLDGAASLPPQVQLLSAGDGQGDVTVQVKVNERGGGVGALTFYLDGKPMEGRQAGVMTDGTISRSFALPPGRYKLEVAASSRGGVEGQRVSQTLVVSGTPAPAALHILAIGVEKYRDPRLELKHSANDASQLGADLAQRGKPLFPSGVNLTVLRDEQASLAGIESAFDKLRAKFRPDDTLVIFLAGHGESGAGGGYVFLPWDFERGAAGASGQGLNEARLQAMLTRSPTKTLLLIDTCEAGSAEDLVAGAYRRLNGLTQHVLIGASRKAELAREGYQGHGVFTAALLETLARKPDDAGDKTLTVLELSAFVDKSVARIARGMPGYQQRVSGFLGSARFPVAAR